MDILVNDRTRKRMKEFFKKMGLDLIGSSSVNGVLWVSISLRGKATVAVDLVERLKSEVPEVTEYSDKIILATTS